MFDGGLKAIFRHGVIGFMIVDLRLSIEKSPKAFFSIPIPIPSFCSGRDHSVTRMSMYSIFDRGIEREFFCRALRSRSTWR